MKRFLILFLIFVFSSCSSINSSLNKLQSHVQKGQIELKDAVERYSEYKKQYTEKKTYVVSLIDLYYGETKEPNIDEKGIQDIIYRHVFIENPDLFTDEEKQFLSNADRRVDEFVEFLERIDQKISELDKEIQKEIINTNEFFLTFNELINNSKSFNNSLENITGIILTSMKLGEKFIDNE